MHLAQVVAAHPVMPWCYSPRTRQQRCMHLNDLGVQADVLSCRVHICVTCADIVHHVPMHAGKLCIEVSSGSKLAWISEELCIGCGICVKVRGAVSHWQEQ